MAGVFDQVNSGIKENGAVAAGGGVSFVPENKGVFDSVENAQRGVFESAAKSRPSDPIYDQWKLEQQMKEQMRQRRGQETAAQEAAAKTVFAPQEPVEQKPVEELRADRKAAMKTAREELRQARAEAGEAYATATDPVAALPVYKKALADANAAFDAAKTAAWEPANRQAAPERYDPFVQNAGQAKAEWYDPAVIAKGEQAKGNPLQEDARKKLAGGGMGNVNAAMEEMRAIDALTEDQKAYINYVYGKYDKKLAGQLTDTLLQNVLNTLNAADERQKTQNVFTAVGGQVFAAPVYAAEMLGQAAENLTKGSNLPVAEYTPGSRMMSEQAARTQDLVDDAKTPVGEFLTQTGVGVGQNVLNMVLFGKAAPAVMAIQSMGSGGYEAAQNGATGWQQLGKGAQSAVTELVTEKISFGKLEDILNGVTPKTAKGIIAKIAAQMATEAGEETAGEAISILYDWIAMGDKGDLAQVMKEYREENGDDGAGGYLALQILQRLGEAAAGGAISGGILGGGATVMNAVQNRNAAETPEQAADLTQETAEAAGDDAARVEAETAENAAEGAAQDAAKPVAETANTVGETAKPVGENTQSVIADSSGVEANLQKPAENTQNTAEKKPPVNWRARNIGAEEDLEAVQPLINAQGPQVEPKAIDATANSVKDNVPQPMEKVDTQKAQTGQNSVVEETSRPANKRSAESRARDAARELHAGKAGEEKILQTIRQMDAANMTPEMRRVVAQNVAKELVKEGPYISKEFWESFAPLREYLKTTQMHIDDQTLGEIKAMGLSVTKFNERYGTRLTTQNKPGMRSLDGNLAQWAPLTNGMVQADEGNAFEALVHTLDTMRQGKAGELDKHGMESAIDGAAEVLLKYADETMEPDELEALDKKDGKKQEIQSSTSQVKPQGTGWEKFEDNRIAQEMNQKPEGAVANMGDAERVRHAEEEIKKAEDRLKDLKENAEKGEIKMAEAVAEGSMTLRQVSEDFSRERVALMAEQLRLIKEWEKTGLKGQKKDIAVQQYRDSNEILDQSDDELFTGEGDQKARLVSTGALMRRTPMRVLVKVFGDTTAANMAIDALVRPTLENESAKIQAINRIFDRVRKLNVNKYESTMVQLVGEGLVPAWDAAKTNPLWHNGQQLVESLPEYAQTNPEIKKLAEHLDRIDAKKVTEAAKELREMYNDYFSLVNEFRLAHGMPEIGHIENYFPHFEGNMDGDLMNQALKAFGIEQMSNLPTGIAGLTANFKPKSRFVANFLQRRGPKTTFDAMAGFQMYTNAVMDMLYHTDDIMRLRYMESAVRERANMQGKKGERVSLSERLMEKAQDETERDAMEKRLDSITENAELEKEYGGFVVWLREYANALAGKGSQFDRGVEGYGSRNLQNVLNKTMSRYSTALVVGNIKSALANVSVVPKTMAIIATEGKLLDPEKYASKALVAMASGQMRTVWHKSEFLSGKEGIDPLVKKGNDVYAEKAQTMFDVIERFMSRFVFATKYQQKMDEMAGLKITPEERENAAVQAANDFAAQIMSRRDKAGATLYSRSRSPVMKMLNMYQNEIWNSFYQNIDDIPNALKAVEKRYGKERARKAFANIATHYVVHSAVLDGVCEAVLGFSIVPNPLEYLVELLLEFIDPDDEEDDEQSNMEAIVAVAADIAGHLPSVSAATALAGYDSGRVPLPNVVDIGDDIAGIKKATTWQGKTAAVIDVLAGIGQFTGFPTAGQLAKTAKGVLSITEGGVRSRSTGQLQTVYKGGDGERLRAVFFGPSGTKGMQQYYESGYKAELTKKQTEAYDAKVKAGVPKDEALEYAKDIMPALTSSQMEAYDAAIGAGIHKDTALSYVKWSKGVTAKKDKDGETIPNSKRIQYLQQANEFESLTGEQRTILYQGALPSDQAKEFEEMTQKVDRLGVDMDTWMEFLERYYQIRGSGKKQRVRELMEDLELPPTTAQILGDIIGYDIR